MGCSSSYYKNNNYDIINNDIIDSKSLFRFHEKSGYYYVHSIYDGDTFTIIVPIVFKLYSFYENLIENELSLSVDKNYIKNDDNIKFYKVNIRLYGVDTYEIKPKKDIVNREEHMKKAIEGKEFVKNLILNKCVFVEFIKTKHDDPYGRPIAKVFINGKNLSELLLENNYAVPYFGGKKSI
jgi:endonuclease YncB( thermonuclease family)